MSTLVFTFRGQDQLTGTLSDISGGLDKVTNKIGGISSASKKVSSSIQGSVMDFTNLANSALNLYNQYDRVENANLAMEKANLRVDKSLQTVKNAQDNLNEAITKYGEDSPQAKEAADKLAIAQDGYRLAVETAKQAQEDFNKSIISATLQAIPGIIGIIGNAKKIFGEWGGIIDTVTSKLGGLGSKASSALETLEGVGGGVGGVGAGGAEGMSILGGGVAATAGALSATAAVALIPLLLDFTGKQEAAIAANKNLEYLMTIRGGGAMATGTNPYAKMPGAQEGGIIDRPTALIAGEAGPEAIIPLSGLNSLLAQPVMPSITLETSNPSITIEIYGPMVNIQGSADLRTARLAAEMVRSSLKNVVIEASSIAAGETHKTIRLDTSSLSNVGAGISGAIAVPKFIASGKLREFSEKFY